MKQGDRVQLTVKKYLKKEYTREYGACTGRVLNYNAKEECIYFLLENEELTNVSLDIIYQCDITSTEKLLSCTGRVKERYYHESGKVLKFEIENGFSVDK